MQEPNTQSQGFTIVELLVVIVVIGILAAITIVSYTGINRQATIASLQSDLSSASRQLKMFKVDNGVYPATISADCVTEPTTTTNQCLKASPGSSYVDYQVDDASNPQSFTLTEMKSGLYYMVTDDGLPTYVSSSPYWKRVAAGSHHSCAITSEGQAYCWGWGGNGRLGNNSSTNSSVPVAVSSAGVLNGKTLKSISIGGSHACAIASDNQAYCWGNNINGQLGNNTTTGGSVPVAVSIVGVLSGKTVKSISVGSDHTCAIASDNLAYCWGTGGNGQLGNASTANTSVPVAVSTGGVLSGLTVKSIVAGGGYTCAIASDNQAYCWGLGNQGQLGNNTSSNTSVPVTVSSSGALSGKTIKSVAPGWSHTCAIASDNQAYCWGNGTNGQLGNGASSTSLVPVAVSTSGAFSGKTIKSIAAGDYYYTCALASDNQVYCWGIPTYGVLGNNLGASSPVPVAVSTSGVLSGKTVQSITTGFGHVCALSSDNQIYCWGAGTLGQLGNSSFADSPIPVTVIPLGS
ncbi:MAG: prepilin-type N-terminal cleavage/methylation domain-containing protein [Actinomycetota bacterium]|nr:prepilin-type N-terminal cleavage/methylation domain-containing protein [Actinomycetota bacterium]